MHLNRKKKINILIEIIFLIVYNFIYHSILFNFRHDMYNTILVGSYFNMSTKSNQAFPKIQCCKFPLIAFFSSLLELNRCIVLQYVVSISPKLSIEGFILLFHTRQRCQ